jgi:hypothetical protein
LARVLFGPLFHESSIDHFMAIGFGFLAGYSGLVLTQRGRRGFSRYFSLAYLGVVATVIWYALVIVVVLRFGRGTLDLVPPDVPRTLQISTVTALGIIALARVTWRFWSGSAARLAAPALAGIAPLVAATALLVASTAMFSTEGHDQSHYASHVMMLSTSILSIIFIALAFRPSTNREAVLSSSRARWGAMLLAAAALAVLVFPWAQGIATRITPLFAAVALLGTLKFVIVAGLVYALLRGFGRNAIRKSVFWGLCTVLLVAEQLPAAKVHMFRVLNPFYPDAVVFPDIPLTLQVDGDVFEPDFDHFRLSRVNAYARPPLFRYLYGKSEPHANLAYRYGVPSYSGQAQVMSRRYHEFWEKLGSGDNLAEGRTVAATETNERFLDLVGARYVFEPGEQKIRIRPTALSRFMLFGGYRRVPENQILDALAEPGFEPRREALLPTSSLPKGTDVSLPAQELDYQSAGADRITLDVVADRTSLLLFNDSYHYGWKATLDDHPTAVLQANYAFMGVMIPKGSHRVEFRFEPPSLAWIGYFRIAAAGLFLVFLCGFGALSWQRRNQPPRFHAEHLIAATNNPLRRYGAVWLLLTLLTATAAFHAATIHTS